MSGACEGRRPNAHHGTTDAYEAGLLTEEEYQRKKEERSPRP
jgi:hypothetical protein